MSEREACMDGIERMYADEVFDAVEAAGRHETTWLTSGGKRVAAIVPPDIAASAIGERPGKGAA